MTYKTLETIHELLVAERDYRDQRVKTLNERMRLLTHPDGWRKADNVSDDEYSVCKETLKAERAKLERFENALNDFLNTDFH